MSWIEPRAQVLHWAPHLLGQALVVVIQCYAALSPLTE